VAWVVGLDGCKAGWFAVFRELETGQLHWEVLSDLSELLSHSLNPKQIGIDVPIGLESAARPGGRTCDGRARKLLGRARASSVFSPPSRPALACETYEDANAANRASGPDQLGLSKQSFFLFPKIREVDQVMTPEVQDQIREVHPELSFLAMTGQQVLPPKKTQVGEAARLEALSDVGFSGLSTALDAYPRKQVARDDVLDAAAVCWSANRLLSGEAQVLPDQAERDRRGLRMEICF